MHDVAGGWSLSLLNVDRVMLVIELFYYITDHFANQDATRPKMPVRTDGVLCLLEKENKIKTENDSTILNYQAKLYRLYHYTAWKYSVA